MYVYMCMYVCMYLSFFQTFLDTLQLDQKPVKQNLRTRTYTYNTPRFNVPGRKFTMHSFLYRFGHVHMLMYRITIIFIN
jgi:hypothetical protein